jgi:hypothetical protein
MAAIRAEMPGIAVGFASIGLCHGVPVLFLWKVSGLIQEPSSNTMGSAGESKKQLAAIAFSLNPKARAE